MESRIKAIESSTSIVEAAKKIDISRQSLYEWLERNNLKVVKKSKLKVVDK